MREAIDLRRSAVGGTRALASAYCYLIEELLDAGDTAAATAAGAELLELHRTGPADRMLSTRNLALLAREGRERFAARMAELPEQESRRNFASLAFNDVYRAAAQEPIEALSKPPS